MSGGAYDYAHFDVRTFAIRMRRQGEEQAAPPALRTAFRRHLILVARAMRAVEWNDSGDGAPDEERLIRRVLRGSERGVQSRGRSGRGRGRGSERGSGRKDGKAK